MITQESKIWDCLQYFSVFHNINYSIAVNNYAFYSTIHNNKGNKGCVDGLEQGDRVVCVYLFFENHETVIF